MARYTIELRRIIDVYGRNTVASWFKQWSFEDYLRSDQVAQIYQNGVWNTNKLVERILDEYYVREICVETPDYWYRRVVSKMREIMERQAQMIWTASIKYDPLVNVDYTETYQGQYERNDKTNGSSTSISTNDGSGLTINSDTPQGQISKDEILQGNYATSTSANEVDSSIHDETNTDSNNDASGNDSYTKNIKGNSGVSATAQRMVEQTRDIIVTIMNDIISECEELFMSIY